MTFDFESTVAREPVLIATIRAAAWSVSIVGLTSLLLLVVGLPLGIASATRARSRRVQVVRRVVTSLSSLPVLLWATLLFAVGTRAFGLELMSDVNATSTVGAAVLALLLGDRILADLVARVEIRTVEVLEQPYMRAVRAGALGVRRHLLQSLVPTVAEAVASRAMFLMGGAIVAERVFAIKGLGYNVINALERPEREAEYIFALAMALVTIGIAFRFLTRVATRLADPRAA